MGIAFQYLFLHLEWEDAALSPETRKPGDARVLANRKPALLRLVAKTKFSFRYTTAQLEINQSSTTIDALDHRDLDLIAIGQNVEVDRLVSTTFSPSSSCPVLQVAIYWTTDIGLN